LASEAIKTCEQALVDDFVRFGDRLSLERRLDRLCKPPRRWKKPTHLYQLLPKVQKPKEAWIRGTLIVSNPGESTAGKKNRWVGYDHKPCSVEVSQALSLPSLKVLLLLLSFYIFSTLVSFRHLQSLALQFYKLKEDWSGMHCEGSIFSTLFSLLFWDIIFYDVPCVFQTPFQG
jgi:Fanconi-associated nuclease 1